MPHNDHDPYLNAIRYDDYPDGDVPMPHSWLGIASVAIAALTLIALGVLVVVAKLAAGAAQGDESVQALTMLGQGVCLASAVVGLALGLISFLVPDRKLVYPVLGVLFNLVLVLVATILMCVGLMAH